MKIGKFKNNMDYEMYKADYFEVMSHLPIPTRSIDIATDFGNVHIHEWKNDKNISAPVFLLPGQSSGSPMWELNLPDFISQRTVYAVDSLGDAGLSVQTKAFTGIEDIATWISAVLKALNLSKIHLVGHSFGGGNAANFVACFPEKVASLALLEPAFALNFPPIPVMFYATVASLKVLPKKWRDIGLSKMTGTKIDSTADAKEDALARMIKTASSGFSASLPTPKLLTDSQLRNFDIPVYIALADNSPITRGAIRKSHLIPNVKVKIWKNTTHSLPMEISSALDKELDEFWRTSENI